MLNNEVMEHYDELIQVLQLGTNYIKLLRLLKNRKKMFRRWWSKPNIANNYLTGYGSYQIVFMYFKLRDEEEFITFTRLNVQAFMYLLNVVEDSLIKYSWRVPIPVELKLALTLNYLAHADAIKKNAWFYSIGCSTVYKIIPEICEILCIKMTPIFFAFPSAQEFKVISQRFKTDLFFPICIGALDGRHCRIKKPDNSNSLFFNYKKFYSVVLMACCDSNKRFIWINIGDCGSYNDAGIFAHNDLGEGLENKTINIPPPTFITGINMEIPHFLIGDGGFPLKSCLMRTYSRSNNMTVPQKILNYRLSYARVVIENAFGILSQRWLINTSEMAWKVSTITKIIMSTVCLHNFILDFENNVVNRPYDVNEVQNIDRMPINNEDNYNHVDGLQALNIRRNLTEYFVSPMGSVDFQFVNI